MIIKRINVTLSIKSQNSEINCENMYIYGEIHETFDFLVTLNNVSRRTRRLTSLNIKTINFDVNMLKTVSEVCLVIKIKVPFEKKIKGFVKIFPYTCYHN